MALPAQFCTEEPGSVIQLRDYIEGEDSGGIWTMTSGNNTGFNASSGTFDLSGRPAGTYQFRYTFSAQAPCLDESTLITVNISDGPSIAAGNDLMVCEGESATLTALGNGTMYVWSDGVEQNKSFVPVRSGYYTVSSTDANGCTTKDSVYILILDESQTSTTADDTMYVSSGKIYDIDLALNDELFSDSFNITVGDIPSEYIRILTLDTKGKMRFEIKESFFETIIMDYELCDLCDQCATGRLIILDEKLKDIILTTIITPTQATNSKLQFSKDPIPDTELWIYNRWGQQIHHSKSYQNDWDADGYPGGVYYYVLKVYGLTIKRALTVVK
ncbi:MAG: gliding motility-associated C-terminal domain-containing protein [Saprospiraceae bacterium]|nr:gliding motility-associated C-terminal domain-containing protein [Saprospiraceae bacterium]